MPLIKVFVCFNNITGLNPLLDTSAFNVLRLWRDMIERGAFEDKVFIQNYSEFNGVTIHSDKDQHCFKLPQVITIRNYQHEQFFWQEIKLNNEFKCTNDDNQSEQNANLICWYPIQVWSPAEPLWQFNWSQHQ